MSPAMLSFQAILSIGLRRYVTAMGNHVVNPVITPSVASGTPSGVLAAALVGPDYKYSAVWTPVNMQLGEHSLCVSFRLARP